VCIKPTYLRKFIRSLINFYEVFYVTEEAKIYYMTADANCQKHLMEPFVKNKNKNKNLFHHDMYSTL
jgi:hypothetical protein